MNILDNPAFKDPQVQMQFFLLMMESIIALWVVNDARTRGKSALHAYWWGLGTLLIFPIVFPAWFFLRPKTNTNTTSSTQSSTRAAPSLLTSPDVGTPVPESGDKARSKICDACGKFYLGNFDKCPHCDAAIEKGKQ